MIRKRAEKCLHSIACFTYQFPKLLSFHKKKRLGVSVCEGKLRYKCVTCLLLSSFIFANFSFLNSNVFFYVHIRFYFLLISITPSNFMSKLVVAITQISEILGFYTLLCVIVFFFFFCALQNQFSQEII